MLPTRSLAVFRTIFLVIFGFTTAAANAEEGKGDIEVMVVGAFHMHNPGRDEQNVDVDSVLTGRRQAELDDLVSALAAFRPTKVMVEMMAPQPGYAIAEYETFSSDLLKNDPNEIVQIGYRLAHRLGLEHVQGIDVQAKAGEEDYFPIDRVRAAAARSGQSEILAELDKSVGEWAQKFSASQSERTIANLFYEINQPDFVGNQRYYDLMLAIAAEDDLAGAYINARWYSRNVQIFAKLMRVATPGDRVVVIYGVGHVPWLRHFAQTIDGYTYVDPLPYLALADQLTLPEGAK